MLYCINTVSEAEQLRQQLSPDIYNAVLSLCSAFDRDYGMERNASTVGGCAVVAETCEDIARFKETMVDYDCHPCEWVSVLENPAYLSALFIKDNDFIVTLYFPRAIAPQTILNDLN